MQELIDRLESVVGNNNYSDKLQEIFNAGNDYVVETCNEDNPQFISEVRKAISDFISLKAISKIYG